MKLNNVFLLILCLSGYIFVIDFLITAILIIFFSKHLDTSYGILIQFYNVYKFLTYLNITCIILSLVHCLFKFKTNFFNIRINKIVFYIGFITGFLPIILYLIPIINTIVNY